MRETVRSVHFLPGKPDGPFLHERPQQQLDLAAPEQAQHDVGVVFAEAREPDVVAHEPQRVAVDLTERPAKLEGSLQGPGLGRRRLNVSGRVNDEQRVDERP